MTTFFGRVGKEKEKCNITLVIRSIEAEVINPLYMSVVFERGPQRDETNKALITSKNKRVDVNQAFSRTSSFYVDKKKMSFYQKDCTLSLGYFVGDKWKAIGTITINMAEMVD